MDTRLLYLLSENPVTAPPVARMCITTPLATSTSLTNIAWNTTSFSANAMATSTSGITVPIQGYYLVTGSATFSSSTSSTYTPLPVGSTGRVDIKVGTNVVALGSAIAQSASGMYSSVVADLVYATSNAVITLDASAHVPSGSAYVWSAGDYYSTFISVSYVCS